MSAFVPILDFTGLPKTGPRPSERYTFDFKMNVGENNHVEMAKDIAALANAIGGSVIVGTNNDKAPVLAYDSLTSERARKLAVSYDVTKKNFLSPLPSVETLVFPSDVADRVVLVVNVWPCLDQAVGARSGANADSWRFPVRVNDKTHFWEPALLPLMTNPKVRRTTFSCTASRRVSMGVSRRSAPDIRETPLRKSRTTPSCASKQWTSSRTSSAR